MSIQDPQLAEIEDLRKKLKSAQICLMWVADHSSNHPLEIERAVNKTLKDIGRPF